MYQATLALSDNPFGPEPPSITPDLSQLEYLVDLDISPLRVDRCPELAALLCSSISNLSDHMQRFRKIMNGRGYLFESPGRRGTGSAVVVLRGAQGAGKTTLASWMISKVIGLPGQRPWRFFELPTPSIAFRSWTELEFEAAATRLRLDIEAGSQQGDHIAVLLEDVTNATWNRAVGLLEQYKSRARFCVITTHDLTLLDEAPESLNGSVLVEIFTLKALTSKDAENYVQQRIQMFRDPQRPDINAVSPIFPFAPDSIQGYMADSGQPQTGSSVTFRVLNSQLKSRIDEHHAALLERGLTDVGMADAADLGKYLL